MTKNRVIPIVLVLLAIGVLILGFLFWRRPFFYSGTIEATRIDVSARLSSVISEVPVHEGDEIKKDQLLMKLDGEDYRLIAEQSERDFKRAERLFKQGSLPEGNYEQLKNAFDQARLRFSWCETRSPIRGTLLERYHEPGEFVTAGTKLFSIADLDELYAYLYVPETVLGRLKLKMEIPVRVPSLQNKTILGSVGFIREEAEFTPKNVQTQEERTRLVYGVKVLIQNKDRNLKPGMTVEAELP